jgi:hypothetical protein
MESKLRKPETNHYNNADHVEYHEIAYQTSVKYSSAVGDQSLITAYYAALQQEVTIYKWIRKSEYTKKKEETDRRRNNVYVGILSIVRANLKNFNPVVRDQAQHLFNLLDNYGNLTRSGYDAQTAAIDSILARLGSSDYQMAVTALGLAAWVQELGALNSLFKTYVEDTTLELIEKPEISPKDARKQTDNALRAITNRVTARINIEGPTNFAAFVKEFNVTTDHYNTLVREHYGRLHVRTDITPAEIAEIDTQLYTGKPIFVIPALTLQVKEKDGTIKTVEPVFSVDFSVAYQNNVNPGTARLIISGVGKYVGEIDTTFNIIKN